MGELPKAEIADYRSELETSSVETPGGRPISAWITRPVSRPMLNLPFLPSFLPSPACMGHRCPLTYSSGIASHKRDWMSKIVSQDSRRRALARTTAKQSRYWLRPRLLPSVRGALDRLWILDIDTTVKTLFGKQSSTEASYNPH